MNAYNDVGLTLKNNITKERWYNKDSENISQITKQLFGASNKQNKALLRKNSSHQEDGNMEVNINISKNKSFLTTIKKTQS